jgi:hypothetical protein
VSAAKEFCVAGKTVVRIMAGYYLHDRRVCSEGILCCGHDGRANNNFELFNTDASHPSFVHCGTVENSTDWPSNTIVGPERAVAV